jgi:hypothetical protein
MIAQKQPSQQRPLEIREVGRRGVAKVGDTLAEFQRLKGGACGCQKPQSERRHHGLF